MKCRRECEGERCCLCRGGRIQHGSIVRPRITSGGARGTYAGRREDAEEDQSDGKSSHGVRPEFGPSTQF